MIQTHHTSDAKVMLPRRSLDGKSRLAKATQVNGTCIVQCFKPLLLGGGYSPLVEI